MGTIMKGLQSILGRGAVEADKPSASNVPPAAIDPDDVFADAIWNAFPVDPDEDSVWRVCTPSGELTGLSRSLEIVDGFLFLLDADDVIIGEIPPGEWHSVSFACLSSELPVEIPILTPETGPHDDNGDRGLILDFVTFHAETVRRAA